METKDIEATMNMKPSYQDFEPFCKWKIEEGSDILEVHLQGFKRDQLKVHRNQDIVTISGERPQNDNNNNNNANSSSSIRFRKEIKLSKDCKISEIKAKFSRGVLHLTLPKKSHSTQSSSSNINNNGSSTLITGSSSMPSNYLLGGHGSWSSKMVVMKTKWALLVAMGLVALVVASGVFVIKRCPCVHAVES